MHLIQVLRPNGAPSTTGFNGWLQRYPFTPFIKIESIELNFFFFLSAALSVRDLMNLSLVRCKRLTEAVSFAQ